MAVDFVREVSNFLRVLVPSLTPSLLLEQRMMYPCDTHDKILMTFYCRKSRIESFRLCQRLCLYLSTTKIGPSLQAL